jgi:hypothetical protein
MLILTHGYTVSLEVLTQKKLTTSAVETLITKLRVAIANQHARRFLRRGIRTQQQHARQQ